MSASVILPPYSGRSYRQVGHMPEEASKGVVRISNEPGTGSEPAHVSVTVDGATRYTIRSSDLEAIGAQLRGKKSFSFFNSIVVPALAVLATTLIAQLFQYISWRNSTTLAQNTERATAAKAAYQHASGAISNRFYATKLYLGAAFALNNKGSAAGRLQDIDLKADQKDFDDYKEQLKTWNNAYDQILNDIDFYMDRPILWAGQRVSMRDLQNLKCGKDTMLLSELERLRLNVRSLKLQFAAIDYCLKQAMLDFDNEVSSAISKKDYSIPKTEMTAAAQRIEDVRSMSNEFRCFAQRRIAMFDEQKRKSIFKLSRWISDKVSALFVDPTEAVRVQLDAAVNECDYTKAAVTKDRFARKNL